jgi:predicted NUDIX family NTP pyrophosphohydrolase
MTSREKQNESAGLVMYQLRDGGLEVFLAHPGGPYFAKKDDGVWGIPKGLVGEGEDLLTAAIREFSEETGIRPAGEFIPLGTIKQKSGKLVHAWGFEGDRDGTVPITSNCFTIEWPPRSGRMREFPEIDRADFFPVAQARKKMVAAQAVLIDRLAALLDPRPS